MSDKFVRIDTTFRLSDSTLNSEGFRLLTSGYQLPQFQKNPIGYYMHQRDIGVLLKWENLQIAGDNITGIPVINMSHPRAQRTIDEIKSGFLSAASMGHFVILAFRNPTPEEKEAGQTGPTILKWFNREASVVDIPGNFNALTLYDKNENPLQLNNLSASTAVLKYQAEPEADIEPEPATAQQPEQPAPPAISPEATRTAAKQVSQLLGEAYSRKIINDATLQTLKEDYAGKPEKLPALLEVLALTKCQMELRAKSYEELDRSGEMELLYLYDRVGFEMKHVEKFGKHTRIDHLSAAEKATAMQTAAAAKVLLLERLRTLPSSELDNSQALQYLHDNDLIGFVAKMQYETGKEHPMVKQQQLDRGQVLAAVQAERQNHINRLMALPFETLDRSNGLAELIALDMPSYREKFKAQFGRYPKN